VASFSENLFALVLGNVVHRSEGMVEQILFFDCLVGLVKGGSEDVSNPVVLVKADPSPRGCVVLADINHSFVVFVVGVRMVLQIGSPFVVVVSIVIGTAASHRWCPLREDDDTTVTIAPERQPQARSQSNDE